MAGRGKCYAVSMDARAIGLRERKKLRTRAQLTDAAIRLFTDRGFDATTVEDIAEAVEVSPRTFFRYFDSKEDVVVRLFDDTGQQLRAMLAARPTEEPPFTAVRAALGSLVQLYTAQADRVLAIKRLAFGTSAIRAALLDRQAQWENGMTDELAVRLGVDPDRDPRPGLVAAVAWAAFSTAVARWVASDGREDLRALVDQALAAVGSGLDHPPPTRSMAASRPKRAPRAS
jgi:AcrR family transcriptional regulator